MKAILIDDEPLALDYLAHQLSKISMFHILGKFTDPISGKEAVRKIDVDIVFLDIHIPEMNGLELAEQLLEIKPELHIVFVTAYDEFALQAFDLNALDYLLKPVQVERLSKTIQRVEERMSSRNYSSPRKDEELKLSMFQQVTISYGEQSKAPLRWRTTKVQELFLYLLQHRGQVIQKSELIELLWPEHEPKKAFSQLYTAIYHIRQELAKHEHHLKVTNTSGGYAITLNQTCLDVDQFEKWIQSGVPLSIDSITKYEQAIRLFRGEYLQGYDYVWAESERQRLQLLWIRTSLDMVNWYCVNHELEKALKLCLDICNRYPLEEEAYFALMKIFASIGNQSAVHHLYLQLQTVLMEELDEEPNPMIKEWYQSWKKSHEPQQELTP